MKNVVITGADRNIGLELVKQFLQRGWQVFAGRYLMELPLLEELKQEYPDTLTLVPLDVSKAPLNMAMNQLFNGLLPEGYTFRMYGNCLLYTSRCV